MRYTIKGHLPNGDTFELKRGNRYVHPADASGPLVDDLYNTLGTILANPFANVTFDSVHVVASVTENYAPYVLEKVKISKNGGAFRERAQIDVRGGDELVIRSTLRRYQGEARRVDVAMTIPADAVGDGFLLVGRQDFGFPTESTGDDFESLIDGLRDAPRNDDLSAQLFFFGQSSYDLIASASVRVDSVVSGYRDINVSAAP